jgi:hypothetical protein
MTKPIDAIYEDGVFRPLVPVDLPNHTPVVVTPARARATGAGILASAGAWADAGPELDDWLATLAAMRRQGRSILRPDEQP